MILLYFYRFPVYHQTFEGILRVGLKFLVFNLVHYSRLFQNYINTTHIFYLHRFRFYFMSHSKKCIWPLELLHNICSTVYGVYILVYANFNNLLSVFINCNFFIFTQLYYKEFILIIMFYGSHLEIMKQNNILL